MSAAGTALVALSLLTLLSLLSWRRAEDESASAQRAKATAEQRAYELRSFSLLTSARERYNAGDPFTALPLALEANTISNPSLLAMLTLADIAYGSRARMRYFSDDTVTSIAIGPDGQTILSGSANGTLRLWELATGDTVCSIQGHESLVTAVSFMPDGKSFMSFGQDFGRDYIIFIAWDASTCTEIDRVEVVIKSGVFLAASADGKMVLAKSDNYSLSLGDLASDDLIQRFEGHTEPANVAVFSPDENILASGTLNGEIILWNVTTGDVVHRLVGENASPVTSLAFNFDGTLLASGSADGTLILWDTATGTLDHHLEGPANRMTSLAFNSDGTLLASGYEDGMLLLWDTRSYRLATDLKGHSASITSIAFSVDGKTLISGSWDRTVILWDVEGNEPQSSFAGHGRRVTSVAFGPDGETILSGAWNQAVMLWEIGTGREVFDISGSPGMVATSVAFSPNGDLVASGSCGQLLGGGFICLRGSLELRSAEDGSIIHTLIGDDLSTGMVRSVAFSPTGHTLLSGGCSGRRDVWCGVGEIIEWELTNGQMLSMFPQRTGRIESIAYSRNGKMAVSGGCARGADHLDTPQEFCEVGEVVLWDLESHEVRSVFHMEYARVLSVAFGPNDWTILSGSDDGILRMWDVASGQLVRTLQGVGGSVTSVAFSPDGSMVLAGMDDRMVALWNAANGQLLRTFRTTSSTTSVAFSPDGKSIIAGSGSNVILWDIDLPADQLNQLVAWTYANRYVRELNCGERLLYQIGPLCNEAGVFPTRTPYPALISR